MRCKAFPGKVSFPSFVRCLALLLLADNCVADDTLLAGQLAQHFRDRTVLTSFAPEMSLSEAMVVQGTYVGALTESLGPPAGYKVGLTNTRMQNLFGIAHPVHGVLLQGMLLRGDAVVVAANFGAVPMSEGDLMVRVGSLSINQAQTTQQALKALDAVLPFLELPDLMSDRPMELSAAAIVAINVGARLGVVGEAIPMSAADDWSARLKGFRLEVLDGDGALLAEGRGSDLLGDPLAVVLWLKDELQESGVELQPGDLLSLGTVSKLIPVVAGTTITARYRDLDPQGPVELRVRFQ